MRSYRCPYCNKLKHDSGMWGKWGKYEVLLCRKCGYRRKKLKELK